MNSYDATKYDPNRDLNLLPDGWHPFRVVEVEETTSKKGGYYQVIAKCKCIDPLVDEGLRDRCLVWNFVTFIPADKPGARMALHWLSCLGQPHEGKFDIDPDYWVGKPFMGKIEINEYEKNGEKKRNNKFSEVSPVRDGVTTGSKPEDSPF